MKTIREILIDLTQGKHDKKSGMRLQIYTIDQAEAEIKALMDEKEIRKIIDKTAVARNKDNITPSFIWNCSLTDLTKAIKQWWEGK